MANTITGLTVSLYSALDVVSRELVGFIPSVTSDMAFSRAAVGQSVKSPVANSSSEEKPVFGGTSLSMT